MMAFMLAPNVAVVNASTGDPVVLEEGVDGEGGESGSGEGEGVGSGDGEGSTEEEPPFVSKIEFEGPAVTTSMITDSNLYEALLEIFRDYYEGLFGEAYQGDKIYTDMFRDISIINLDRKGIASFSGMERLELDSLTTFSANINEIKSFDQTIFRYTDEDIFESLSLAGNDLGSIDISNLTGLTYVDLSSNRLTHVDFGNIVGKVKDASVEFNLANNNFSSIEDIVLPNRRIGHVTLNIINNNITNFNESHFSSYFTMRIGVQGFVGSDSVVNVDTGNNLKVYKIGGGLAVRIRKTDSENPNDWVKTITDDQIEDDYIMVDLPVGEYEYIYAINNGVVDGEIDWIDAFKHNDASRRYLDGEDFGVLPQKVGYYFTHKGKDYETLNKVTGKVTVTLSAKDEGAEIFYSVNGGDWIKGNVVNCDQGGSYSIKAKTVLDGVESEEESIWVRTSLNLYISDWLMLVLLVLLALVLFLVVLPIISKKYFKKD